MRKKIISVLVCMLLIITVLPVSGTVLMQKVSNPLLNGKTLYVGGDGPGNYSKIQDAIDEANNGDTVFVFDNSSPYHEDIVVGKSINLIGENRDTTVIVGKWGTVIELSADWVNISGFTIKKGDSAGIWIDESNHNIISGNTITLSATWGVYLESSSNNTISDNNINLNNGSGIALYHSNNNTISSNNISNNKLGMSLESKNNFSGNYILNNTVGITLGSKNTVSGNNILNNKFGINIVGHNNIIKENNIQDNDIIGLLLSSANYNLIESNNFIENRIQASYKNCEENTWDENYWDNWIGIKINMSIFQKFPKIIFGILGINFDWHPAKEPYEI